MAEKHDLSQEITSKINRYKITPKEYIFEFNNSGVNARENFMIKEILNKKIRDFESKGDLEAAIQYINLLATFLASEENEDPIITLTKLNRTKLKKFSRQGYNKVKIVGCGEVGCYNCRSLNGQVVEIKNALRTNPLPNPKCKTDLYGNGYSFCRCDYVPLFEKNIKKINTRGYRKTFKFIILSVLTVILSISLYLNCS